MDACLDNLPESFHWWAGLISQLLQLATWGLARPASLNSGSTEQDLSDPTQHLPSEQAGVGRVCWNMGRWLPAEPTNTPAFCIWGSSQPYCIPGSPSPHPCSWMTLSASGPGSENLCHLLGSKVKVCWEPWPLYINISSPRLSPYTSGQDKYPQKSPCWGSSLLPYSQQRLTFPPFPSCLFLTTLMEYLLRAHHFVGARYTTVE